MPEDFEVRVGDALEELEKLPDGCVQTCVTSPPYWGLRDYQVDGQLGLEPTPESYVEKLVAIFGEVRRVLSDDGTLWLNLGDSYASSPPGNKERGVSGASTLHGADSDRYRESLESGHATKRNTVVGDLKPKDMVGIPWRVAFALQSDGWWLRSDIIWRKPNPMPESVTDRPTSSHEHIFLLAKGEWSGAVEPVSLSGEQASWLAALIDGEGTIGIGQTSHGGFQGYLAIANTDRRLLDRVTAMTGVGNVTDSGKATNHTVYRWQVTGPQAASILYRIRSKLIAKRRQADNLLSLQETHKRHGDGGRPDHIVEKQEEMYERAKALNQGQDIEVSPNKAKWRGGQYYYDHEAIKEDARSDHPSGNGYKREERETYRGVSGEARGQKDPWNDVGGARNKRDVWTITTKPFPDAHFAVYPPELIVPCIKAGSAKGGLVLDPFCGAGTTGVVCTELGRRFLGIELNPEYAEMARDRIMGTNPTLFRETG